jgi:hypothetical protein
MSGSLLDGSDEDKKPAAKVILSVETDDLMEGKGIVFSFRFPVIFNTVFTSHENHIVVF